MEPTATLVATLTEEPSPRVLAGLEGRADVVELRSDLAGDVDPAVLREAFSGRLLYTLRSEAEGGRGPDGAQPRARRLAASAAAFDLVDLEERDLDSELLAAVPAAKRLVSWHGPATDAAGLRRILARLARVEARLYKLVPAAGAPAEALVPLELLRSLDRRDVVAFASGPAGGWSRLLALRLGAPLLFASAGELPAAPGQPRLGRMLEDFGLPELPPVRQLYGVVGWPVRDSLSPRLHNGLYRYLELANLYLPFEIEHFADFWLDVVESGALSELGFDLRGLSVTAPHKEVALAVAGAASPLAGRIGSANTMTRSEGVWEAESTDPAGVLGPLRARRLEIGGQRAAVVGAGGAGRAAAFALAQAGAEVALINRSAGRGERAARRLGLPFLPLSAFEAERFDLVVHATPLGVGAEEPAPVSVDRLPPGAVLIDLAYRVDRPTRLIEAARARGLLGIDGREVLLYQAAPQFERMTGRPLPVAVGAELLGLEPPTEEGW